MNEVILIGRITKDIEISETKEKKQKVTNFDLAVKEVISNKEHTEFFRITAFSKLAENIKNYLKKGDKILVKGKLKNSYFVSKNGLNQKLTYILAKEIIFL